MDGLTQMQPSVSPKTILDGYLDAAEAQLRGATDDRGESLWDETTASEIIAACKETVKTYFEDKETARLLKAFDDTYDALMAALDAVLDEAVEGPLDRLEVEEIVMRYVCGYATAEATCARLVGYPDLICCLTERQRLHRLVYNEHF